MLQAPVLDGPSFDPFPFQQDGLAPPEVDIGGGEVHEALVVAVVIVVLDKGPDLSLEVTGQIIGLQQDAVFKGLVPALDLALGLGMVTGTAAFATATSCARSSTRLCAAARRRAWRVPRDLRLTPR